MLPALLVDLLFGVGLTVLGISDWDFSPVQGYRKWLHRHVLGRSIRAGLAYRQVGQP